MNCDRFKNRYQERLRGGLSGDEQREVEQHAEECADCRRFAATYGELTCREFVDFLHAYIDRELPSEQMSVFERHLSVCPECTNYFDGYRKTIKLSVAAMSELTSREIPERLVQAILEARKRS